MPRLRRRRRSNRWKGQAGRLRPGPEAVQGVRRSKGSFFSGVDQLLGKFEGQPADVFFVVFDDHLKGARILWFPRSG